MATDKPRLALEEDQDSGRDGIGITQLTPETKPEHTASSLQLGERGFRNVAEGRMLHQRERWCLVHREMLKSMKPLEEVGSGLSEASWLKLAAVSSLIQASNISWHIWSEISSVNVAGV